MSNKTVPSNEEKIKVLQQTLIDVRACAQRYFDTRMLTSLPLKIEFAKRNGLAGINEVHAYMTECHDNLRSICDTKIDGVD
jgi:hypothetical protein